MLFHPLLLRADHQDVENDEDQQPWQDSNQDSGGAARLPRRGRLDHAHQDRLGGHERLTTFRSVELNLALTTVPPTVHGKAGRGDWIRTSDLHTPSVMRYQAALRPDLAGASRQGYRLRQGVRGSAWVGVGEKQQRLSGLGAAQLCCWPCRSPISSRRWSDRYCRPIATGSSRPRERPSTSRTTGSTPIS